MLSGFIAKKSRMDSLYTPQGERIAVTRLTVAPLTVTQIKNIDKDGYSAIQVAFGTKKSPDKSVLGKIQKLKLDIKPQHFKEFQKVGESDITLGQQITAAEVFTAGDEVTVVGRSKGRGFAGVIKRYGFQRQPVSGGQSDRVRAPGAIGAQTPGKVIKGKKMPGHYGNKIKNISGLKIIAIDTAKNEVLINGPVPGSVNSFITIYKN